MEQNSNLKWLSAKTKTQNTLLYDMSFSWKRQISTKLDSNLYHINVYKRGHLPPTFFPLLSVKSTLSQILLFSVYYWLAKRLVYSDKTPQWLRNYSWGITLRVYINNLINSAIYFLAMEQCSLLQSCLWAVHLKRPPHKSKNKHIEKESLATGGNLSKHHW